MTAKRKLRGFNLRKRFPCRVLLIYISSWSPRGSEIKQRNDSADYFVPSVEKICELTNVSHSLVSKSSVVDERTGLKAESDVASRLLIHRLYKDL